MQNTGSSKLKLIVIIVVIFIVGTAAVSYLMPQVIFFKIFGSKGTFNPVTNTVNIKDEDQQASAGQGAQLVPDFPSDIPQYPAAKVVFSSSSKNDGIRTIWLVSGSDQLSKVIDFYKAEMIKNGWAQTEFVDHAVGAQFKYKKDKRTATVLVILDPKKDEIAIDAIIQ